MNTDPVANASTCRAVAPCARRSRCDGSPQLRCSPLLAACSGGGGPGATVNQPTGSATADAYTGPPPAERGRAGLHDQPVAQHQGHEPLRRLPSPGRPVAAVRALRRREPGLPGGAPLVNLTNPSQSTLVQKVAGGHNCWLASPSACAATMLVWIQNWAGSLRHDQQHQAGRPAGEAAGSGKHFPATATSGFRALQNSIYPMLTQFCSRCHCALGSRRSSRTSPAPMSPRPMWTRRPRSIWRRPTCRASTSASPMTCITAGRRGARAVRPTARAAPQRCTRS